MERASFDLDLLIDRHEGQYRARVLRSPAGDGQSVTFGWPFQDLELENFLLKMGKSRGRTRRVESAPVAAAKQFGGRLFAAVFTGPVGECLRRSADRAQDQDATLRIRLRLADCPELADLPWEFLYDRDDDWFVALSGATPVVRYLQLPNQPRPLSVTLPLRVLAIRSEPSDYPPLDLEGEWARVLAALGEFTGSGAITVTDLTAPTLGELRRVLLRERFHVLHYMGHGGFTEEGGGVLLFTDQAGRGAPVTGEQLSVMLRDQTSLRLAVLNACEAGRTDPGDPFGGIADILVRRGVPAVVAMQFEISDTAAIEFAPAFYGALAAGRPVDVAVAEARKAVYAVSPLEWATPVLHLRADDARLFDIAGPAPAPAPGPAASQAAGQAAGDPAPRHPASEAESAYRDAVRRDPASASAHADLAGFLSEQERYPEAEACLREAIRLDPGDGWLHGDLGDVLFELARYHEAGTAFRRAVRLNPGNAAAHAGLGRSLNELQRYREAEAPLREAVRLSPGSAAAHASLGHALFEQERYPEAETALREAVRLDPGSSWAQGHLGYVLAQQERYREAEAPLRAAIRLNPGDASAHGNLGGVLAGRGEFGAAEAPLREAIRLDPGSAMTRNNLGYVLSETGRRKEAEAEFEEALRLDPEHEMARDNLAALRRGRKK